MGSVEKLVIDTDCGVDDAMAIMLALSSNKRCDVIGITCTFGNTPLDNACNNVKRVLTICNKKEIPVYRGSSRPLVKEYLKRDTAYHSFDGLGTVAQEFSTGDIPESEVPAAVALIELSKKHQGEITLIPLGPLTNIALAHRIDPDFTRRLKSIVCMGGNYKGIGNHTETAEFNFFCDPYSADIVMGGALCPVKLVPWETCLEHGIPFSTYESLKQVATVKGHFYNRISCKMIGRAQERGRDFCTDCDLLAVVAALYPECIKETVTSSLAVETSGTYTEGLVIRLLPHKSPIANERNPVQIVTEFHMDILNKLRFAMLQEEQINM